jgi:hypothetical protein
VWRLGPGGAVASHTGRTAQPRECVVDETGRVYLDTDIGFGLVHTLDMETAADCIEQGRWTPLEVPAAQLPGRYGYVVSPAVLRAGA